jgi:hypothetical protein
VGERERTPPERSEFFAKLLMIKWNFEVTYGVVQKSVRSRKSWTFFNSNFGQTRV